MNATLDLHAVYEACAPAAIRRARALLGNQADAWDVVQEVQPVPQLPFLRPRTWPRS